MPDHDRTEVGLLTILCEQWEAAQLRGEVVSPEEICKDHPDLLPQVREAIRNLAAAKLPPKPSFTSTGDPALPRDCRYRLVRFLAEGGLGKVYVGFDTELRREVAIKFVHPHRLQAMEAIRRFKWEAEVTGQLEHPGIAPVYGLIHDEKTGQIAYAMRLLRGETLQEASDKMHSAGGPAAGPPFDVLLGHFVRVCRTIDFAHKVGFIHRDLKPSNIMVAGGETWVLDWGLAKSIKPDMTQTPSIVAIVTREGQILGTPSYMPPEQAAGEQDKLGPAADIYALGGILYQLLTGKPPHHGANTAAVLRKALNADVPPARELNRTAPADLEAVCKRAMAREPEDRYATAGELADVVDAHLETMYKPQSKPNRTRLPLAVASLMFLAAIGVFLATYWNRPNGAPIAQTVATQPTPATTPSTRPAAIPDADRRAALALKQYGAAFDLVLSTGKRVTIPTGGTIPDEPFTISRIDFFVKNQNLTQDQFFADVLLPQIADLTQLTEINDRHWQIPIREEDYLKLLQSSVARNLRTLVVRVTLTQKIVEALRSHGHFTGLGFDTKNGLDASLVEQVGALPALDNLALFELPSSPPISPKGMEVLSKLSVQKLHLPGSRACTPELMSAIAKMPRLKDLQIGYSPSFDDRCLDSLTTCKSLLVLFVRYSKVTEAAVKAFAVKMPQCRIHWEGGVIEPRVVLDADRRAAETLLPHGVVLTVAMKSGGTRILRKVDEIPAEPFSVVGIEFTETSQTRVYPKGFASTVLIPALAELTELNTLNDARQRFRPSEDEILRLLKLPFQQKLVTFHLKYQMSNAILDQLLLSPNLRTLGCTLSNVDDALLERFREFRTIKQFKFQDLGGSNQTTRKGILRIASLPVEYLQISFSKCVDPEFATTLIQYPQRTGITLVNCLLQDDAALVLAKSATVRSLALNSNPQLTDKCLLAFSQMKQLQYLDVKSTGVTDAGVKAFAEKMPQCRIEWDGGAWAGGVIEPRK